jgi:hypothetical protein
MTNSESYLKLPLRAHNFLRDVPLHDVWALTLRGGTPTITDMQRLLARAFETLMTDNLAFGGLFRLRLWMGKIFGWDGGKTDAINGVPTSTDSYIHRLTAEDRARSSVTPGTKSTLGVVVYQFEHEALSEIRNATVHAFALLALEGNTVYVGIYVKPVNWLTPFYMALIDPFRNAIIYPALMRRIETLWARSVQRDLGTDSIYAVPTKITK